MAIARALACEVDIIEVFRKLAHDDGKCVIVVPHSKEVAAASDEVLHLKRGKLTT
ncbi:hypothetical protein RB200_34415 [Streptomyces sp. PmtG]